MPRGIPRTLRPTVVSLTAAPLLIAAALAQAQSPPARVDVQAGPFAACNEPARADLHAGLSSLALLDPAGARNAFARAEREDSGCVMAPLLHALAWVRLPDADASPGEWQRAEGLLRRRLADHRSPPIEREWLAAFRPLVEPLPPLARLRAFAKAAQSLARRRAGDRQAATIAALASIAVSSVPGDEWERRASEAIAPLSQPSPSDPATATMILLTCRTAAGPRGALGGERAGGCLAAARAVTTARPRAPRALGLAGRVLLQLGEWETAEAAAGAALTLATGELERAWLEPGRWREHPLPLIVQADIERGRHAAALARLNGARARYEQDAAARTPLEAWRWRSVLDLASMREQWARIDWQGERAWPHPLTAWLQASGVAPPADAALARSDHDLLREVRATRWLLEGLLAARAAWPRGEPERLAAAAEAASQLQRLAAEAPVPPRLEWMRTLVLAAVSAALEAREEFALLRLQLDGLQRELADAGAVESLPLSGEALVGEWHLQLRDLPEAANRFATAAQEGPGRARSWLGLARAARAAGSDEDAAAAYRRLLEAWASAEAPAPELREARAFVEDRAR